MEGILERISDGVLVFSAEGEILRANRPLCRMLGLDPLGAEPQRILGALAGEADGRLDLLRQASRRGGRLPLDVRLPAGAGRRRLLISFAPLSEEITLGIARDLTARARLEQETRLRACYQQAMAALLASPDRQQSVDALLGAGVAILGRARRVSRCYFFRNEAEDRRVTCVQEWLADGVESFQQFSADHEELSAWLRELQADRPIVGSDVVRDLPEEIHAILRLQGVLSVLVVPLRIEGALWGFLGLDECFAQRQWSGLEVRLARTYAGLLAALLEPRLGPPSGRSGAPAPPPPTAAALDGGGARE